MKRLALLLLFCLPVMVSAQMVGSSAFLQGQFLEIGVNPNGSFGTDVSVSAPSGYHPHGPSGANLGEVYDIGHDGWTVGSPQFMGDYTLPGSPYEAWEIEVAGTKYSASASAGTTFTSGGTGGITSYQNFGGTAVAVWSGTAAGGDLLINSTTQVDTFASWVIVKVNLQNVGSSPLANIYYLRTCDPDNTQSWGGSFSTTNIVDYQQDPNHGSLVSGNTTSPTTYMGIGAKDMRAKAFIYTSWPLSASASLSSLYGGSFSTTGGSGGFSGTMGGDIAIGLLFNLGTLNPGMSTNFSYAYIFSGPSAIDSIFPVTIGSRLDSFRADTTRYCHGPEIRNYTKHFYPGSYIKTYYGDGTWDTASVTPGYGTGTVAFTHTYTLSGTYTVWQVLYIGPTAVDSIHF